jgi:hypothetical protein
MRTTVPHAGDNDVHMKNQEGQRMRRLSMFVPVHFSSAYRRVESDEAVFVRWWQWHGRTFSYKVTVI